MDQVWLAQLAEYDVYQVTCAAASPEAAERHIKAMYGPPYVVEWEALASDEDGFQLIGHFTAVQHYSTAHVAVYDITPVPLVT